MPAFKKRIAVITPYRGQVAKLEEEKDRLAEELDQDLAFQINTIDAFQGQEKDIVIFNCVRSNNDYNLYSSLGFLNDLRRLNVAITRPKHFLFLIGNSNTLNKHKIWKAMIDNCKSIGGYIQIDDQPQDVYYDSFVQGVE